MIGKQGKVINKIIEDTGVQIDIEDDGSVAVCGTDMAMIQKAIHIIEGIVNDVEPGQVFKGRVVSIIPSRAFIELVPGKEGGVHISKIAQRRIEKIEDVLKIGDEVYVKVLEIDKMGRINLSIKDVTDEEKAGIQ